MAADRAIRLAMLTPFRFRILLAVVLGAAFLFLQQASMVPSPEDSVAWRDDGRLHVFFHPECPHCHEAIEFLKTQPSVDFVLHDVSRPDEEARLLGFAGEAGIAEEELAVPLFVRGPDYMMGFDAAETSGRELLALAGGNPERPAEAEPSRITLPLLGEIDPSRYSLFAVTALIGLSDGLNPCAMWVLVYLISLIAGLEDRRKIWWLVGTFVLSSGILYFLFMTAWLNTFLLVGYIRPLTQLVALIAIGFGMNHLFELAVTRGVIVCQVGNPERRQRMLQWARDLVAAPVGVASLLLVIGLAFTVNAIEFVCSAALPAIYTHMLTLLDLTTGQYYGYIALYVTFFMLDDLVIFGFAAFAVQKIVDSRYGAVSRAVGGVMLVGLGLWLLLRQAT